MNLHLVIIATSVRKSCYHSGEIARFSWCIEKRCFCLWELKLRKEDYRSCLELLDGRRDSYTLIMFMMMFYLSKEVALGYLFVLK